MGASENRALIKAWMSLGQTAEGCRALATPDFVWHVGRSTVGLITGGPTELRGEDAFRMMDRIAYGIYADGKAVSEPIFTVAEGDWVVIQTRIRARTFEGKDYENIYVFSFRCENGKVAEFWEHADTKHWWDSVVGRPDQYEDVKRRLVELRADNARRQKDLSA